MPERDPAINPVCVRCGSDAMIPDAFLVAKDLGTITVQVGVHRRPRALMLKQSETTNAELSVCGECGFVELRASDPDALWEAHLDRLANGS